MKKLYWDIETTGLDKKSGRIISVVLIDEDMNTFKFLVDDLSDESEAQVIKDTIDIINSYNNIIGWNSTNFDFPFLMYRMQKLLPSEYNKLEPFEYTKRNHFGGYNELVTVKTIENIDLMDVYKKYSFEKNVPSYKLNTIAQYHGVGEKINLDGSLPIQLYNDGDKDLLMKYNIMDVELLIDIDNKLELTELLFTISKMTTCRPQKAHMVGHMGNAYFKSLNIGEDAPPGGHEYDSGIMKNKGGLNLEAEAGIYHNVLCCDFESQYPYGLLDFGLTPEIEDVIINLMEIKKNSKGHVRNAAKAILNGTSYGMLSYKYGRYYKPLAAAKLTKECRDMIQFCWDTSIEYGYKPIMTSTDSIYIEGAPKEFGSVLNKKVKEMIAEKTGKKVSQIYSNLEIEEIYKTMILTGKIKNNIRVDRDDNIHYTGTIMKRLSTNPKIVGRVYENIVKKIANGTKSIPYINKYINESLDDAKLIDIGIPFKLGKTYTKQSDYKGKGAKWSNDNLGYDLELGDKCYVYEVKHGLDGQEYPQWIALTYEDATTNDELWRSKVCFNNKRVKSIIDRNVKEIMKTLDVSDSKYVQTRF